MSINFKEQVDSLETRIKIHDKYGSKNIDKWMIDNLNLKTKKSILDLGCGDGRVVIGLSLRTQCRGTGIDIESKCIQKFNKRIERWKSQLEDKVQAIEGDAKQGQNQRGFY